MNTRNFYVVSWWKTTERTGLFFVVSSEQSFGFQLSSKQPDNLFGLFDVGFMLSSWTGVSR